MGPAKGKGEEGEEGGISEESREEGGRAAGVGEDDGGEGSVPEVSHSSSAAAVRLQEETG
eukprot:evm.model.NODE_28378_length_1341_cov_9.909023.1